MFPKFYNRTASLPVGAIVHLDCSADSDYWLGMTFASPEQVDTSHCLSQSFNFCISIPKCFWLLCFPSNIVICHIIYEALQLYSGHEWHPQCQTSKHNVVLHITILLRPKKWLSVNNRQQRFSSQKAATNKNHVWCLVLTRHHLSRLSYCS